MLVLGSVKIDISTVDLLAYKLNYSTSKGTNDITLPSIKPTLLCLTLLLHTPNHSILILLPDSTLHTIFAPLFSFSL